MPSGVFSSILLLADGSVVCELSELIWSLLGMRSVVGSLWLGKFCLEERWRDSVERVESLVSSSKGDAFTEDKSVAEASGISGSLGDVLEKGEALAAGLVGDAFMGVGSIFVPEGSAIAGSSPDRRW